MAREVVIVGAARTPIGAFMGALSGLAAPRLGAAAIQAACARAGVRPGEVSEVLMGCVLQAGLGQAPARQAALLAGLEARVPAVTVNKVCGSGLKAVIAGAQAIALGDADIVVAGGMESMSNAPYLTHATRGGARMGHVALQDSMILDGLTDAYDQVHMGLCAEECAAELRLSREEQDAYAATSTARAIDAARQGAFRRELAPLEVPRRRGDPIVVAEDEGPASAKPEKLPRLLPAFKEGGTVTAGNASSISDGAAALVLMSADDARVTGRPILARVVGHAGAARRPKEFPVAPADAIASLLAKTGRSAESVGLWEINEAFAVVALANMRLLSLDPARVNVRGGGVVLGHPIGASGARILVTLLHAMEDRDVRTGIASLCIGGGEGIALMIEREAMR